MAGFESLLAGRTLCDRYRIDALIGRGGMGVVYRATDLRLGREVAVKVITHAGGAPRAELRARFQREARAAARIHHPNVVTIHDFGTDAELDLDFLVMGLLRGEDLATRMAREAPLPADEALVILRGAARGVAAGHRAGMVHRDVKPGNLFLCDGGDEGETQVRVLDFGIVQLAAADDDTVTHYTRAGGAPLSPAYAAPEQLRGEGCLGPPCDVYALGAIAYELLSGRRPFADAAGRATGDPLPSAAGLGVPEGVAEVILRTLAHDPADRFPHAGALLAAIHAALAGETGFLPPRRVVAPVPAAADVTRLAPAAVPAAATEMATARLLPCPECERPVSPRALACPGCGSPLAAAAAAPVRGRGRRVAAFAGGFAATAAAVAAAFFLLPPPETPASTVRTIRDLPAVVVAVPEKPRVAEWVVDDVSTDGGCGSLFDACIRVRCTIANTGEAAGMAKVTAHLVGTEDLRRTEAVRLSPGQREQLTFHFREVEYGESYDRATCTPRDLAEGDRPSPPDPPV